MEERPIHYAPLAIIGLLIASVLVSGFNTYHVSQMGHDMNEMRGMRSPSADLSAKSVSSNAQGIIPTGEPPVYGAELGIRYDDVSADNPQLADQTIAVLAQYDRNIKLDAEQNERYVNILTKLHGGISCEYCCGAPSIIFTNGAPACGCAHSFAMRGVAKYLITEHGDEFTDEEIFTEMAKWKTLFFPTQMQLKADALKAQGIEASYSNVASNEYRGIEKGQVQGTGGGMVGGC